MDKQPLFLSWGRMLTLMLAHHFLGIHNESAEWEWGVPNALATGVGLVDRVVDGSGSSENRSSKNASASWLICRFSMPSGGTMPVPPWLTLNSSPSGPLAFVCFGSLLLGFSSEVWVAFCTFLSLVETESADAGLEVMKGCIYLDLNAEQKTQ